VHILGEFNSSISFFDIRTYGASMKYLQLMTLSFFVTTSVFANVTAYFNNNEGNSYTDPYRKINRRGDNLEAVILDQIKTAKKSIFIAVQELRLPLVASALIEKKAAGVDVRIVLENSYNFTVVTQKDPTGDNEYEASKLAELKAFVDVNKDGKIQKEELETRDAIYMLREAKIPIMDDTFDTSRGSGLMHHKFMLVDGKSTIVSTANFTMSCIHGDMLSPASRGNANSMILVQSPGFTKTFTEEFSQLWGNGKRGNFGHNKTYRGPISMTVKGIKITVQFSPTSQKYHWEESVNGLIASQLNKATRSIKALLFVFSDQKIADVMERRHEAGVSDIGVIIEPKFAFRDYSELLDMLGIAMLNQKCAYEPNNSPWKSPIKEVGMAKLPQGDVLHHKFAVIDNKIVVVGSENWSDAANFINDETLLVIQDAKISAQFAQEYNRIKKTATLGAPTWLKSQITRQETACRDQGFYF
jgi:phosphatidylserine/phosphatidylglycerophosphate/cardiolipin synthase-like enzyme